MTTLRQLRYFSALARHLHFGKAAADCSISQPALSMQIKELEDSLGASLLERQKTGLRLTRHGSELALRAERILAEVRNFEDYARHSTKILSGRLRLGVIPTIAPYILPQILSELEQSYPDLELQIRETVTEVLIEELLRGRLDVVLAALPIFSGDLESRELFADRFLLARQAQPEVDERVRVSPSSIEGEKLLLLEEGHCLRSQALSFCQNAKINGSEMAFGATSLTTILQMVAAGYGVTLLPELCASVEGRDERIALLRFTDPQPERRIGLIWRKSSSRGAEFIALGDCISKIV